MAPPPASGPLPLSQSSEVELDRLINIRNLFAFLTGQPLVATKKYPTTFHLFIQIGNLLREFGFSNIDNTSFGSAVELSFGFFIEQMGLADCRNSREKTIEALILGEKMKSVDLYSQAFAHAAGKYSAILDLQLPLYDDVSAQTRQSLERAHLDLLNRQQSVNDHLEQFNFPSLFAGLANSTSTAELKQIRFKSWKSAYSKMRSFVLSYYKSEFGNWPPKASSKKNPFAESGLNRLVLKVLYSDMCSLYDLLVDRNNLTTRFKESVPNFSDARSDKLSVEALRGMLSESDRSTLPVRPPIPFDTPQQPEMSTLSAAYSQMSAKDQTKFEKKVKEDDLAQVLTQAYNTDTNNVQTPFLSKFKDFELSEAKGKSVQDIHDLRYGYWLFLYVVVQSLPMVVVDAPGLKFAEGVEYFLCQPPMGNPPWVEDRQAPKMWYNVPGEERYVELSADTVNFSVEATFDRSHCWIAASQWQLAQASDQPVNDLSPLEPVLSPLKPPSPHFQGLGDPQMMMNPTGTPPIASQQSGTPPVGGHPTKIRARSMQPGGMSPNMSPWRSSMAMGLEPVNLPPQMAPGMSSPPISGGMSFAARSGRSSSMGPPGFQGHLGNRSSSAGNLAGMNMRGRDSPTGSFGSDRRGSYTPSQNSQRDVNPASQKTFDDILGASEAKPVKKKSFFF